MTTTIVSVSMSTALLLARFTSIATIVEPTFISMTTLENSYNATGSPLEAFSVSGSLQSTTSPGAGGEGDTSTTSQAAVILQLVILSVLWVSAFLGNVLVCIVIHRSKRLQSTTNHFVVSLACTDHLFSLGVVPFLFTEILLQRWPFGAGLCKVVRMLQFWTAGTAALILICISLDRFYTILYPLSFKISRQRAKQMIAASWITSLVGSLPNVYFFNTFLDPSTDYQHCSTFIEPSWGGIAYTTIYTSIHYIFPFFIVTVVYVRIFRFIWTIGRGDRTLQRTANPVPRAKVKMVKLIIAVTVAVFCLISPFFIAQLWQCSTEEDSKNSHLSVFIAVTFIFYINTSAKPGLYLCYNSNFRRGCREVFFTSTMKCYRSEMYTITNNSKFARLNHIGIINTNQSSSSLQQTNSRLDSPTKTFNRSTLAEKMVWPLTHNRPSTYL